MEKYDGIRVMWEKSIGGECGFRTKGGGRLWKCTDREMAAPLEAANMRLDGEMWSGHGQWDAVNSFVSGDWKGKRFKVFDAPGVQGGLLERLAAARASLAPHSTTRVQVVQKAPCEDMATADFVLTRVLSLGGEGLVSHATARTRRVVGRSALSCWPRV